VNPCFLAGPLRCISCTGPHCTKVDQAVDSVNCPHGVFACRLALTGGLTGPTSGLVRRCPTLSDIVRRCPTLSDVVQHCQTLSDIVRHCQTLSDIVRHFPTFGGYAILFYRRPRMSDHLKMSANAKFIQHIPTTYVPTLVKDYIPNCESDYGCINYECTNVHILYVVPSMLLIVCNCESNNGGMVDLVCMFFDEKSLLRLFNKYHNTS
jgi:hypothetical protein